MRLIRDDLAETERDKEAIAHEIIDDPDVYFEGAGPEGPWPFKSLTVTRIYNTVYVYDVDGVNVDSFDIGDILADSDEDIYENLIERLEQYHEESHERL